MHSTIQTTFIGTQESVYRDSPAGKLEEIGLVRTTIVPLQQGFDSNSQACLSVSIDNLSALAFEQRVVGIMPLPNSTAVGTPFACMPAIHNVQMNIIVKTSLLENLLEFKEWDTHDGFVEILSFGIESFKLLNGNVSIILDSKIDDFFDHLPEIGIDKTPFSITHHSEFLSGIVGLKNSFALHELLAFCPDVPPKIGLTEGFAFWGNYTDSEILSIDINTEDILPMPDFRFFGQVSNNLQVAGQTECLASPAIFNKCLESLIVPVLFNGYGFPVPWIHSKFDKEIEFGFKGLAVSWNIEFYSQPFDFGGFVLPSSPYQTASDLNIERGGFLAN